MHTLNIHLLLIFFPHFRDEIFNRYYNRARECVHARECVRSCMRTRVRARMIGVRSLLYSYTCVCVCVQVRAITNTYVRLRACICSRVYASARVCGRVRAFAGGWVYLRAYGCVCTRAFARVLACTRARYAWVCMSTRVRARERLRFVACAWCLTTMPGYRRLGKNR